MTETHECPYGGEHAVASMMPGWPDGVKWNCGEVGWLCDRCKEDRADSRVRALLFALRDSDLRVDLKVAFSQLDGGT